MNTEKYLIDPVLLLLFYYFRGYRKSTARLPELFVLLFIDPLLVVRCSIVDVFYTRTCP